MSAESWCAFFGWCAVVNIGLLSLWGLMFVAARDWMYAMHSRWFALDPVRFDTLHYAGMAAFKLTTVTLFIVPWAVLRWLVLPAVN